MLAYVLIDVTIPLSFSLLYQLLGVCLLAGGLFHEYWEAQCSPVHLAHYLSLHVFLYVGFYGRPWSQEQRCDLFSQYVLFNLLFHKNCINICVRCAHTNTHTYTHTHSMSAWGLNVYLYAPKDDDKHRAYWRDLYTLEEANQLSQLIRECKNRGIIFVYAIAPGLDITFSSNEDVTLLKRKLDQVSSSQAVLDQTT